MSYIPFLRAGLFSPFLSLLKRFGAPAQKYALQAGVPVQRLHDPEAQVPMHSAFAFLERAARAEGIDSFGLLAGRDTEIADLGVFGHQFLQSFTLHEALHTAQRIITGLNSGASLWLAEGDDTVRFCFSHLRGFDEGRQHAEHFALRVMLNMIRLAAGPDWRPSEVHLESARSGAVLEAEEVSHARVFFAQEATCVVLPRSLLAQPLLRQPGADRPPPDDLRAWLAAAGPKDLPDSVRRVIASQLSEGRPDITLAAALAGMSVRTFQRQLEQAGLTYQRLVDQVRFYAAVELLGDRGVKMIEIAHALGYSDAAHFTRAFRRWTGVEPSEFRRLRIEGPAG